MARLRSGLVPSLCAESGPPARRGGDELLYGTVGGPRRLMYKLKIHLAGGGTPGLERATGRCERDLSA